LSTALLILTKFLIIIYTQFMILGVDGGASKTQVIIADDNGSVLAEGFGGSMLWSDDAFEASVNSLESAISDACSKIGQQMPIFNAAVLGIAGLDSPSEISSAKRKYSEVFGKKVSGKITVVNDMVIALLSGSDNPNAVVLNAGTGASCFGINHENKSAKSSGLDYILSDEGSAFYIGHEILRAAVRSSDGRGKKSLLEDLLKQHYSIDDLSEIKSKIYGTNFNKAHIAKLSYLVIQAAEGNDEVAQSILQNAIKELALAVKAVVIKLGIGREQFDLVLTGGLFNSKIIHPNTFGSIITNMYPLVNVVIPHNKPAIGAIKLALKTQKYDQLAL